MHEPIPPHPPAAGRRRPAGCLFACRHRGPVADNLQAHVDQLVAALDTYATGDFAGAYAAEREASAHMFMTGAVLSAAIAGQFPDEFPTSTEPSDTAMARVETVNPLVLIGTALVALTGLTLTRRTVEVRSSVN